MEGLHNEWHFQVLQDRYSRAFDLIQNETRKLSSKITVLRRGTHRTQDVPEQLRKALPILSSTKLPYSYAMCERHPYCPRTAADHDAYT
jgi:hypothetical protein